MTRPIVIEFEVAAPPERAFRAWTERCSSWWPRSHSMSESEDFDVVFEPHEGGRIFERGPDGVEHDWGRVTVWEPPHSLEYRWHIFLDPDRATRVSITFQGTDNGCQVRLVNDGFEVFGEAAEERVGRVGGAWLELVGGYRGLLTQ